MLINRRYADGDLPIVNPNLGKLYNYITQFDGTDRQQFFDVRLLVSIDDDGKRHEMIYFNQNNMYQLRIVYKPQEDAFKVAVWQRITKRCIKAQLIKKPLSRFRHTLTEEEIAHAEERWYDDTEFFTRQTATEIANTCIMQNSLQLPFERLRWAILLQAFDDYRLANNRLSLAKKYLKKHEKEPYLTKQQFNRYSASLKTETVVMDQIREELKLINPYYVKHLSRAIGKRYRDLNDLKEQRNERERVQQKRNRNNPGEQ